MYSVSWNPGHDIAKLLSKMTIMDQFVPRVPATDKYVVCDIKTLIPLLCCKIYENDIYSVSWNPGDDITNYCPKMTIMNQLMPGVPGPDKYVKTTLFCHRRSVIDAFVLPIISRLTLLNSPFFLYI